MTIYAKINVSVVWSKLILNRTSLFEYTKVAPLPAISNRYQTSFWILVELEYIAWINMSEHVPFTLISFSLTYGQI